MILFYFSLTRLEPVEIWGVFKIIKRNVFLFSFKKSQIFACLCYICYLGPNLRLCYPLTILLAHEMIIIFADSILDRKYYFSSFKKIFFQASILKTYILYLFFSIAQVQQLNMNQINFFNARQRIIQKSLKSVEKFSYGVRDGQQ
jgi:hypothetical protein